MQTLFSTHLLKLITVQVERKNRMNNLQLFNFEGNQVRTLKISEEPYFVGKDVAEILGYKLPTKAIQDHVDAEDKGSEIVKA